MVSFSCEACGDVLTKKKLDAHRYQCRGASFTCLDCMVHFRGTEYRVHTACVTEDQKYQGALYKPKPSKAEKRKSVSIVEPKTSHALVPRAAYVEDAPDLDIPPPAPSPPPAVPAQAVQPVNVFDFLVDENTPNASRLSLGESQEQMSMKKGAESLFSVNQAEKQVTKTGYKTGEEQSYNVSYEEHGFSYGTEPLEPVQYPGQEGSPTSLDFMTPLPKANGARTEKSESGRRSRATSDKKRKRGSPEALDLSAIKSKPPRRRGAQGDTPMADAPPSSADTPALAHSGLTGGLNRLLSDPPDRFPPTPEYSDEKEYAREMERKISHSRVEDPVSPLKRTRHSKYDRRSSTVSGPGSSTSGFPSIKGRAGRIMSMVGGSSTGGVLSALNPAGLQNKETAVVRVRRRGSSSEEGARRSRKGDSRKSHKLHEAATGASALRHEHDYQDEHVSNTSNTSRRRRGSNESRSPEGRRRKIKALEYTNHHHDNASHPDSDSDNGQYHHNAPPASRPRGGGGAEIVVFGEEERLKLRAESFLAHVTKGPDSERGCSINKALKRWHRDGAGWVGGAGGSDGGSRGKEEEQKELWRGLRLRKNDRGEVVVFF